MTVTASPAVLFRRAGVKARSDSPSVAQLEAQGWTVEHVDPRYGNALMKLEERTAHELCPRAELSIADEDEAAELCL